MTASKHKIRFDYETAEKINVGIGTFSPPRHVTAKIKINAQRKVRRPHPKKTRGEASDPYLQNKYISWRCVFPSNTTKPSKVNNPNRASVDGHAGARKEMPCLLSGTFNLENTGLYAYACAQKSNRIFVNPRREAKLILSCRDRLLCRGSLGSTKSCLYLQRPIEDQQSMGAAMISYETNQNTAVSFCEMAPSALATEENLHPARSTRRFRNKAPVISQDFSLGSLLALSSSSNRRSPLCKRIHNL